MDVKILEEKLRSAREATKAKVIEKADADRPRVLEREIAFEEAKLLALSKYAPEQLFEADVAAVGPCLLHWPDDTTYDYFMKQSGAIKGDLSKMSADKTEDLLARCAIYPDGATMLKELRANNPHARTVIASQLLAVMKGRLEEEGK